MYCFNGGCKASKIEKDDNFCYVCGHWTAKGYMFLKNENNAKKIIEGPVVKQNNRLHFLWALLFILLIIFLIMFLIRKDNMFKPFFYIKKETLSIKRGYNVTLLDNDNQYENVFVGTTKEAKNLIKNDYASQNMYCFNEFEVEKIALDIEKKYNIASVSFCDMPLEKVKKIKEVIDKMYMLFPNVKGALTNINIANTKNKKEYIAKFQPLSQFVNVSNDINNFNKVNKTQILLNSYYFLNDEVSVNNKYVTGATLESLIAHEFGHYISFYSLLKEKKLENIVLVTKDNYKSIYDVVDIYNNSYSSILVNEALMSYNSKYGSVTMDEFSALISTYASQKNEEGKLVYDELIAEAVHDYYLHGDNMSNASSEIINILKVKLSR